MVCCSAWCLWRSLRGKDWRARRSLLDMYSRDGGVCHDMLAATTEAFSVGGDAMARDWDGPCLRRHGRHESQSIPCAAILPFPVRLRGYHASSDETTAAAAAAVAAIVMPPPPNLLESRHRSFLHGGLVSQPSARRERVQGEKEGPRGLFGLEEARPRSKGREPGYTVPDIDDPAHARLRVITADGDWGHSLSSSLSIPLRAQISSPWLITGSICGYLTLCLGNLP
ncbi:hypothetical protein K431DRAFT_94404 [Polychaeton citri CBS 116435]|uniref:Uncharacterized protein n=1 Tax=Polychaeton citri CBS 116435 TaxID=1314669 RepID=A0A9P4UN35_9PEZI|nr:hypothetical protein K431DRAFT_94404 [Polychaeton citri CBS 116435]